MRKSKHRPAVLRDSWKKKDTPRTGRRLLRFLARAGLTVVVLGLIAGFIYLLADPILHANTHLVLVTGGQSASRQAEPLDFFANDLKPFQQLKPALATQTAALADEALPLTTEQSLGALRQRISDLPVLSRDVLILYLSAHGVVIDGEPYVTCQNFDPTQDGLGRISVSQLIQLVAESPAATKLIILESGQLGPDARLGTVANLFPSLVRQEVEKRHDDHLWVLGACDSLERSLVSVHDQRTAFGYFVAAGLQGKADLNADGILRLRELFRYVQSNVGSYAQTLTRTPSQTPFLYGTHADEIGSDPVLMSVQPLLAAKVASATPAAADLPEESTDAPATETTVAASGPPTDPSQVPAEPGPADELPAEKPADANLVADSSVESAADPDPPMYAGGLTMKSPMSGEMQKKLAATWNTVYGPMASRQRDSWDRYFALEQVGTFGQRPIDYAPVAWRALGELILTYDHQLRQNGPSPQVADRLQELIQALTALQQGTPVPELARNEIIDQIVAARPKPSVPEALLHSLGSWEQQTDHGLVTSDSAHLAEIAALDAALAHSDSSQVRQWLADHAEWNRLYEPWLAQQLLQAEELRWAIQAPALKLARLSEQVAGSRFATVPWVSEKILAADGVRDRSLALIHDQTVARWDQKAVAGFKESERLYRNIERELDTLESALRLRNDLVFRLFHYKRLPLFDRHSPPGAVYLHFDRLVDATLALDEVLRDLAQANWVTLQARSQACLVAHQEFLAALLPIQDSQANAGHQKTGHLESLLHLPVIDTTTRSQILLMAIGQRPLDSSELSPARILEIEPTAPHLDRTLLRGTWDHFAVELKIAKLAALPARGGASEFEQLAQTFDNHWDAQDAGSATSQSPEFWSAACQSMDAALSDYYQQLPRRVVDALQGESAIGEQSGFASAVRQQSDAWRAALMIDPRDVASDSSLIVNTPLQTLTSFDWLGFQRMRFANAAQNLARNDRRYFASLGERYRQQMQLLHPEFAVTDHASETLEISGTAEANLTGGKSAEVEITCKYLGTTPGQIYLYVDYNLESLSISELGSESAHDLNVLRQTFPRSFQLQDIGPPDPEQGTLPDRVVPQLAATFTANPGESRRFRFRLSPQPNATDARFLVSAAVDHQVVRHETSVVVAARSNWELVLEPRQAEVSYPPGNQVFLHPLPNQASDYEFFVRNRSDQERAVSLALLAPQRRLESDLPFGDISAEELQTQLDALGEVVVLHRSPASMIPANGQSISIPMFPPPDKDAKPEPPAKQAEPLKVPIRHGILAILTDTTSGRSRIWQLAFRPQQPSRYLRLEAGYDLGRERVEIRATTRQPGRLPAEGHQLVAEFQQPLSSQSQTRLRDRVTETRPSAELFAEVSPAPGRIETVYIHVDDYPRAFIFHVPCWDTVRQIQPSANEQRVLITAPAALTSFQAPRDVIEVQFQVDAPLGSFDDPNNRVEIGIDADRDRELIRDLTIPFSSDRQAEIWFLGMDADGKVLTDNRVGDFRVELPGAGYRNARVNLLGRLIADSRVTWSDPVEIKLDANGPDIKSVSLEPGNVATAEDQLTVSIMADDHEMSGVASVQIGLADVDGNLDEALPKIDAEKQRDHTWVGLVPLADLPLGANRLFIRATDAVGNTSEPYLRQFQIATAEQMEATRKEATFRIRGGVYYYGNPVAEAAVNLTAPDGTESSVNSDESGTFRFRDLPAGTYSLKATSVIRNKPRFFEGEVIVGEGMPENQALVLELK